MWKRNRRFDDTDLTADGRGCRLNASMEASMAKLALIYGMRLLPVDDLGEVKEAMVVLKNGKTARVAMHLIEGSKEEIEETFRQSIDAFFEMYPEI
jgi:hypothetical protein